MNRDQLQAVLEKSSLYAMQQKAAASAAAVRIQAAWRTWRARQQTASRRLLQQEEQQLGKAAVIIQVCISSFQLYVATLT